MYKHMHAFFCLLVHKAFAYAALNYLENMELFSIPQGKSHPVLQAKKNRGGKQGPTTTDVTHFLTLSPLLFGFC